MMMKKMNPNRKQKKWEGSILPSGSSYRKRITGVLEKYNKQGANNLKLEHEKLLNKFGENVIASRSRRNRPEIYDQLASKKYWDEHPEARIKAIQQFRNDVKYFESDRIKRIIKEWKEINPNVSIPTEIGGDYELLKLYLGTDPRNQTKAFKEDTERAFRRWFSRKVSEPEFEQRIKNEKDEREFVNNLYKQSKYKGKMSFDDYEQTFYSVMREAMAKNKLQYSSDTIRTAIMDNGIDTAIEEGELNQNAIDSINNLIEENFAEIQELNSKLFGGMEKSISIPSETKTKISRISGERRALMKNPDTDWFEELNPDEVDKLLLGSLSRREQGKVSEMFTTVGELNKVNSVIKNARRSSKNKRIPYNLETYEMAKTIMERYKNISSEYELGRRLFEEYDNKDFIEAAMLLEGRK